MTCSSVGRFQSLIGTFVILVGRENACDVKMVSIPYRNIRNTVLKFLKEFLWFQSLIGTFVMIVKIEMKILKVSIPYRNIRNN